MELAPGKGSASATPGIPDTAARPSAPTSARRAGIAWRVLASAMPVFWDPIAAPRPVAAATALALPQRQTHQHHLPVAAAAIQVGAAKSVPPGSYVLIPTAAATAHAMRESVSALTGGWGSSAQSTLRVAPRPARATASATQILVRASARTDSQGRLAVSRSRSARPPATGTGSASTGLAFVNRPIAVRIAQSKMGRRLRATVVRCTGIFRATRVVAQTCHPLMSLWSRKGSRRPKKATGMS